MKSVGMDLAMDVPLPTSTVSTLKPIAAVIQPRLAFVNSVRNGREHALGMVDITSPILYDA
jgi:hypothetical protein